MHGLIVNRTSLRDAYKGARAAAVSNRYLRSYFHKWASGSRVIR
jgi:hypothetical protein